ncbi:MAG: radical SAM protein [Candidatus Omnitrophica bacterium]|nr:radical SAM protein [Candidatus Omnitrophota bacterium]
MRTTLDNASKFLRLLARRRSAYPHEIQIEVTNACNMKCAMCPHTHGAIPQEDFSVELFRDLVQHNPAPKRLVLTGWGEPLLHRHFFELIEMTNRSWPSAKVRFTTNGILLHEENRRRIAQYQISGITASVDLWPERDSISPEWRTILHPPSPKTFRNLVDYSEDQDLQRRTPLMLQCLLVGENEEDVRQYIRFAAQRSLAAVNLVRMQSYPQNSARRPDWPDEQRMISSLIQFGRKLGVSVRSVNRQPPALQFATHFDRICLRTDDSLYITVDGGVTPCCNLRDYRIGALSSQNISIADAWNSDRERTFFSDQSPVCGKCDALFHKYRED